MTIREHRLLGTFYPDLERRFFSYDLSSGSVVGVADLFASRGYEAHRAEATYGASRTAVRCGDHPETVARNAVAIASALREHRCYFDETHLYVVIEGFVRSRRTYESYRFTWRELDPRLAPARRVAPRGRNRRTPVLHYST
ncbi:MAG: hypothetical protein MI724_05855 [Spirochaetales bacterium]|nr:hypothetical protein [Spirochaetales bacterium]